MQSHLSKDIDLAHMAEACLNHLRNNPRPLLDYECRFAMNLIKYPVWPDDTAHDPVSIADTDIRMDWAFGYIEEILAAEGIAPADTGHREVAAGLRARVLKYLRDDGWAWSETGCMSSLEGVFAMPWGTGKLLYTLAEDIRRQPDAADADEKRRLCRKIFEAMRARADIADGRAFYAGGNGFFDAEGWAVCDATPYHAAMVLEPVIKYFEATGDVEALDFAKAFAAGEMANDQWKYGLLSNTENLTPRQKEQATHSQSVAVWPTAPADIDLGVAPDGSFLHHSHLRGHLAWGMAHLAEITGDPELKAWSLRLLDFYLSRGTDYGWIPESVSHPFRSETCAVSDVISMAACLARAGHTRYWDTVERFVRNYIRKAQFFVTPEYEALYRSRHPGEAGERGVREAAKLEGGFQGGMGINDRLQDSGHMDMMGCCVPEGLRAVYTAWHDTALLKDGVLSVNMNFSVKTPAAAVRTFLPDKSGVSVTPAQDCVLCVRLADWADRGSVKVTLDGKTLTDCPIEDGYVLVGDVKAGCVADISYPVAERVQTQTVANVTGKPERRLEIKWRGNDVVSVSPKGEYLPLYL